MTGKVLIVDDISTQRKILRFQLERDYYLISEAKTGAEALQKVESDPPDLILLDVDLPDMGGIDVCRKLKQNPKTQKIPIILITVSDDTMEKYLGLQNGADDFLSKPINQQVLFVRIRNLLRLKRLVDELEIRHQTAEEVGLAPSLDLDTPSLAKVLLVIEGKRDARVIEENLTLQPRFKVEIVEGEDEALNRINAQEYDAVIIGEELSNNGVGLRLIATIRSHWSKRDLVIIFLANSGFENGLRALELGANDYLIMPFDLIEFSTRLRTQLRRKTYTDNLRRIVDQQLRLSVIDALTGLHNRRYFDYYLANIIERSKETNAPFAIMLIDLDRFKQINDVYGHDFGDHVLLEFADRIKENLRAADMIVRFGGEEFVIIAPNVNLELAKTISERVRTLVENKSFITDEKEAVSVTVSIGVAMVEPGDEDISQILKRADKALYLAKEQGRNRVIFAAA